MGGVQGQHIDDDLNLVAEALDESGAEGAVDEASREDRALARSALATEERPGNPPCGVHALLNVDREREEVDGIAGGFGRCGGGQQHGVSVEVDGGRAIGLLGKDARLKPDGVASVFAVVDNGFREFETRSFHGQGWLLSGRAARRARYTAGATGLRSRPAGNLSRPESHYRGPSETPWLTANA